MSDSSLHEITCLSGWIEKFKRHTKWKEVNGISMKHYLQMNRWSLFLWPKMPKWLKWPKQFDARLQTLADEVVSGGPQATAPLSCWSHSAWVAEGKGKASQGAQLSLSSRQPRQSSPPTVILRASGCPCLRPISSPSAERLKWPGWLLKLGTKVAKLLNTVDHSTST